MRKQKVLILSDQRSGSIMDLPYEDGIVTTPNKLGSWDVLDDYLYPFSNKKHKLDALPLALKGPMIAVTTNHDSMSCDLSKEGLLAQEVVSIPDKPFSSTGKMLITGRNAMAKGINKATRRSVQEKMAETILMITAPAAFLIILVFAVGVWKAGYFSSIPFIGGGK